MLRQLSHVKNSGWSIVEGDHITWFNDFNGDYGRLAARFLTMLSLWIQPETLSTNQFLKCRRLPSSITPTRILTAPSAGHSFDENCFGMFWTKFWATLGPSSV